MESIEKKLDLVKKLVSDHLNGDYEPLNILNLFGQEYGLGVIRTVLQEIESKNIKYVKLNLEHMDKHDWESFNSENYDLILYDNFNRLASDVKEMVTKIILKNSDKKQIIMGSMYQSAISKEDFAKLSSKCLKQMV